MQCWFGTLYKMQSIKSNEKVFLSYNKKLLIISLLDIISILLYIFFDAHGRFIEKLKKKVKNLYSWPTAPPSHKHSGIEFAVYIWNVYFIYLMIEYVIARLLLSENYTLLRISIWVLSWIWILVLALHTKRSFYINGL